MGVLTSDACTRGTSWSLSSCSAIWEASLLCLGGIVMFAFEVIWMSRWQLGVL